MRNGIFGFGFLVLLVFAGAAVAEEHGDDDMGLYTPDKIEWQEGPKSLPPGAKVAVLEGDPNKEGPFIMRLRFPDGYFVPAHTHPKTERVTVLSGTLMIVMDEPLDKKRARSMPAGSFGYWPPGMKHLGWADGETVIQLYGIGPWAINYLNPADDPRNK